MGKRLERRRRRWGPLGCLAALLGASVLTSGFLPTQAQDRNLSINITSEPEELFVGGDLTLRPGGKLNFSSCSWNRWRNGEENLILVYFPPPDPRQHPGPDYTGRETTSPKCSLHIRNLTLEDSANYVVSKKGENFDSERGELYIKVNAHEDTNENTNKGVIADIAVGTLAGALLIRVLF